MLRIWGVALTLLASCVSARAADTFTVSIERQPLAAALQQLARQCDVQMIFFSRVTEGLSAPALEGDYTLPAAMERMLAGSGLTFTVIDPQTIEVRPAQARPASKAQQKPVAVPGVVARPLEEVFVVGLAEQLVATRIATPLNEIPQTISIVSSEQMRERNEFTLADALAHTPGITIERNSSLNENFYARGYQIMSFHIDGGAAILPFFDANLMSQLSADDYLGSPDLIEFDHLEILRGADSLFTGNGNPSGTISLVRKRPQRHFAVALDATAGSWGDRRVAADITGPIALDGALRGRAAAVYSHDGFFYEIDAHERKKIFAALEYDLGDGATLTGGASYQWDDASGRGHGVPLHADGTDSRLSRDTAVQFEWESHRSDLSGLYVQYRQDFASLWALKLNAASWRTDTRFATGDVGAPLDPVTHEMNSWPYAEFGTFDHEQRTADLTLTGALDWFGWREELAIGGDFLRVDRRMAGDAYSTFGRALQHPRAFDRRAYPDPRLAAPAELTIASRLVYEAHGVFASLRIDFDEAWSVVGGARASSDSTHDRVTAMYVPFPAPIHLASDSSNDRVVTPYAAAMYAIGGQYALYASYSEAYVSQSGRPQRAPGHLLGPIRGVSAEAGIKAAWRGGALNGTLAAFWIEQRNLPMSAPGSGGAGCCSIGATSEGSGLDAELSGEVARGWRIGAGYTYNSNRSPERLALFTITPKHLLKAWTSLRLRDALNRWQIGASMHAQSASKSEGERSCSIALPECIPADAAQSPYAVFDMRAGFDIDENWRVSISVNNVLDKRYYESVDTSALSAWYGEPRNWVLRFDGRY